LDGDIISEEYYKLKSALPYDQVFKLEEIQIAKEQKSDTQEFKFKVASMRTHSWQFTSLDDKLVALKDMAKKADVSDDIAEIAVEAVRKVNTQ
jgi:hypothetical protein